MPRQFFKFGNGSEAVDEEGVELPSRDDLRIMLRQALTAMLHHEAEAPGVNVITAKAYDEDRKLVMRAQASFAVIEL